MHPLTLSCFLLHLLGRLSVLALSLVLEICLPSLWGPPFPHHASALFFLSFELFILSITQEDAHTLRERSCSVCESSVRLGHHDDRLLGPTNCLPHKDGGVPLSVLPKDTKSKLAGLFSTVSLLC